MKVKYEKEPKPQWVPLIQEFADKVASNKDVDPEGEYHWGDLTYGWALAKGLEVEDAKEFASFVRYCTNVG